MNESTRVGVLEDIEVILSLIGEGRASLRESRGGAMWLARHALQEPLKSCLKSVLTNKQWLVQIACIDQVPLGVLIAEHQCSSSPPLAMVHELFVVDEARGIGLAELMMDALIAWAVTNQCHGVDAYALPGDRATKNFFERFGLVARGIVVHRSLL